MAKYVLPIEATQLSVVYECYVKQKTLGERDEPFIFAYEASKYGKHFSNPAQIGNTKAEGRQYSDGMADILQSFSKRLDSCRRNPDIIRGIIRQMSTDVRRGKLSDEVHKEYIRQYGPVASILA